MRSNVLRKQEDFDRLRRKGKSIGSKFCVLVYLPNNLGYSRYAYLASKKIGNSVERHRSARLLRESRRLIEKEYEVPNGMDYLYIAKNQILNSNCADVKNNIEAAMKKEGLIKKVKE